MNEEVPFNPPGMADYIREGARKNSVLLAKLQRQSESANSEPAKPSSLERVVRRIFERLDEDIRDRRGLKHEWDAIDDDVMNEELRPAWEKILTEEISRLLNAPNSKVSDGGGL